MKFNEKKIDIHIGQWLLLISMMASFSIWFFGTKTFLTGKFYFQGNQLMFGAVVIILIFNLRKFLIEDWLIFAYAILIGSYSFFTTGIKYVDTPELNLVLPTIILIILCYKVCRFTEKENLVLFLLLFLIIVTMSIKTINGLSQIISLDRILSFDNSLRELWINVNTIGSAIMVAIMLITIIMKQSEKKWMRFCIVFFYLIGLFITWICQSKTSLMVLFLFIILDNFIPKAFFQRFKLWLSVIPIIYIAMPFVSHFFADSAEYDLFTGREDIWKRFFDIWTTKDQFMQTGLGVYVDPVEKLSTHNSYLYTLSNYGIFGYILLFGFITLLILLVGLNGGEKLSKKQVSCMLAFFMLSIYATMEDTLLVASWMPLFYIFIGFALNERTVLKRDKAEKSIQRYEDNSFSRMERYHL